jgi:hypothetical protein
MKGRLIRKELKLCAGCEFNSLTDHLGLRRLPLRLCDPLLHRNLQRRYKVLDYCELKVNALAREAKIAAQERILKKSGLNKVSLRHMQVL